MPARRSVCDYSLDSFRTPIAVATWTGLPADIQAVLPPANAIEALVTQTLDIDDAPDSAG